MHRAYSTPLSKQMEGGSSSAAGGVEAGNGHRTGDLDSIFAKMGSSRVRRLGFLLDVRTLSAHAQSFLF